MTKPIPSRVYTPTDNPEVHFAQVFERPNTSLTRPPVGVLVFYESGGYRVCLTVSGRYTGDYTIPPGLTERRSDVVKWHEAKRLMHDWLAEVETAVQAEWDAA